MQEYFEGVERAREELKEELITEEPQVLIPPNIEKKYPRSWVSDAICEYTQVRDKKRKGARKRQKAGRRANRGR